MMPAERELRIYRLCQILCWLGMKLWNRFEIRGTENIPAEAGCIIASNHASFLDPPAIGTSVRQRIVRFMARDTLYKKGFANWLMVKLATIPVARDKGDLGALKKSIAVLKEGWCVGIFPEGTRTSDGELQQAKGGVGFLIAKAGVPVVPAYVHGTFNAYPRGAKWIRPSKIRVTYGPPIPPSEISALGDGRGSYDAIASLVMARIAALRDGNK